MSQRKSLNDIFCSDDYDHQTTTTTTTKQAYHRRASLSMNNSLMNKIRPFFNGSKSDNVPEYSHRVRYIRESCKVFSDVFKSDKDVFTKSFDTEISKSFREFRGNDLSRTSYTPPGYNGRPSILYSTIDDFISIHEYIDEKRRDLIEKFRTLSEQAKEKQNSIRQIISEQRDEYEKAARKFENAESNLRKFQNRDRQTIQNYDVRLHELEEINNSCDQSRANAWDTYTTETYRLASEEHAITRDYFLQFLFFEQKFYQDIDKYLSERVPQVEKRLNEDKYAPSFHYDLAEHCSKTVQHSLAYPIETCIRLLEYSIKDEGLFRLAPSQNKQKKFIATLDLQLIDEKTQLKDLPFDANVVASALKQYLRELPECLLTDALFKQWIEIPSLNTEEERLQRISELLTRLPKVNYDNLCYLIKFLNRVAEYSSENKMTATNLGICIGCSLLYPKEQSSISYTNSSIIVELMINHYKQLFSEHTQQNSPSNTLQKTPPNSNENLVNSQTIDTIQPSPRLSTRHRAPPPPPPPRPLLVQIEPTNIGESSTEDIFSESKSGSNSPTTNDKERRLNSKARSRFSLTKKDQEKTPIKDENNRILFSPTLNDGDLTRTVLPDSNTNDSGQTTNDIENLSNNETLLLANSPEITQF